MNNCLLFRGRHASPLRISFPRSPALVKALMMKCFGAPWLVCGATGSGLRLSDGATFPQRLITKGVLCSVKRTSGYPVPVAFGSEPGPLRLRACCHAWRGGGGEAEQAYPRPPLSWRGRKRPQAPALIKSRVCHRKGSGGTAGPRWDTSRDCRLTSESGLPHQSRALLVFHCQSEARPISPCQPEPPYPATQSGFFLSPHSVRLTLRSTSRRITLQLKFLPAVHTTITEHLTAPPPPPPTNSLPVAISPGSIQAS